MFSHWFSKNKGFSSSELGTRSGESPLAYNWILTGRLAIGPMPKSIYQWKQLETEGFKKRFSCCYAEEHIFTPIPSNWISREVSLPDHRSQDLLTKGKLIHALQEVEEIYRDYPGPLYLHCFAGQERSVLVAIGLVCILERKDLYDSLAYVRHCHKQAKPLYTHLDLLEQVLTELRA